MTLSHQQRTILLALLTAFCVILGVRYLKTVLLPFFLGFLVAYILNGPVNILRSWGIPRSIASALCVALFLSFIGSVLFLSIPFLIQQLKNLGTSVPILVESYANTLTPILNELSEKFGTPHIGTIKQYLTEHLADVINWLVRIVGDLFTSGMAIANIVSLVFLTPIISLYLLSDWDLLYKNVIKLVPLEYKNIVSRFLSEVNDTLSSYAKGQLIVCMILIVLYSISLALIGFHKPLLVGTMTGILSFVPYLGAIIGFITSVAVSLLHYSGWQTFILIGAVFIGVALVEGNFLTPRFVGNKIGLHPVWVLFSLLAVGSTFGFVGIIFALPISAILRIMIGHIMHWYHHSEFYLTKGP